MVIMKMGLTGNSKSHFERRKLFERNTLKPLDVTSSEGTCEKCRYSVTPIISGADTVFDSYTVQCSICYTVPDIAFSVRYALQVTLWEVHRLYKGGKVGDKQ